MLERHHPALQPSRNILGAHGDFKATCSGCEIQEKRVSGQCIRLAPERLLKQAGKPGSQVGWRFNNGWAFCALVKKGMRG